LASPNVVSRESGNPLKTGIDFQGIAGLHYARNDAVRPKISLILNSLLGLFSRTASLQRQWPEAIRRICFGTFQI
jgi:hypothetical protein